MNKDRVQKNNIGIFLMIVSSLLVCFGQLFWKLHYSNGVFLLFMGFLLYGLGALFMIIAYRYGKLSVLQPILSLSYVFSLILAHFLLNEEITIKKIVAIIIILSGVLLICISGNGGKK